MFNLQQILSRQKSTHLTVGLDIGSSNLKIAALSKKENVVRLDNLIIQPVNSKDNLTELIKKSWSELAISTKIVSTSLSGDGVILRYASMPRMNKEELNSSVRLEASKYIPVPLESVFLDSVILKPDCPDNKMLVLIAAVNKTILEERLKLLKDCGLTTRLIDIDSLAAINAFNYFYFAAHKKDTKDKEGIAILDIGARTSTISILQDEVPYFTRTVAIAGNEFDKKISSGLNISEAEAKKIKEGLPNSKNSEAINILTAAFGDLLNEIQISFDYFESHLNASVKKIFLLGGASKTLGLKEALLKSLEIEVIEPDITEGILAEEKLKNRLKENPSSLAVALGLGLRDD